jgi:uncharacterized protein YjbJ (UPF0337 family)
MNRRTPNDEEVRGKFDEAAGTVKQHIGRAVGNPNLEDEGTAQRSTGNVESSVGKARRKVSEGLDDLSDKINKS